MKKWSIYKFVLNLKKKIKKKTNNAMFLQCDKPFMLRLSDNIQLLMKQSKNIKV